MSESPAAASPAIVPFRPSALAEAEEAQLRAKAGAFLAHVREEPAAWRFGDSLTALGAEAMAAASNLTSLLDARIGTVLGEVTEGSPVAKTLLGIKLELDKINPAVLANQPVPYKWLVFFTRHRLPGAQQVLEMVAAHRETVRTVIVGLQKGLWAEHDKIVEQAEDLKRLADNLAATQEQLQADVYLGQLMAEGLTREVAAAGPDRREALSQLLADLSMKIVDLQTIDNLNLQSRTAAEQLIRNARLIGDNINRINGVLATSVINALAVRAAAVQQAQTLAMMNDIQRAIGETMVDTAQTLGKTSDQLARMSQSSVVDLKYLEQACAEYERMVESYAAIRDDTTRAAAETSRRLGELNTGLRRRADALGASRHAREG